MSSERLDEGSCADTQQMGQATDSSTSSKKLVPTDKGAKKKTSFWEKVSKTFRKSGKKDAEMKNLEDEPNLEKTLASDSSADKDKSTLDASAVNIGGAGEVSIVGANIGTLNYYMTPATGFQDAPSISESADEQRKEKSDVLNLGRGTNVFLNKVLYEDGNGSVKIYEGEFPKFEGVYKAAVKFLPYSKNAKREAESVEKIRSHKYVVGIFETGINESSPMNGYIYISMERCSKMTLYDYVIESRCLDQQQALNHSMQIISGLEYIHGFKIAHRDLKPHNILFVDDGRFEQIKIADFGMSKNYLVDSSVTVGGKIGTKGYSAPELIRHKTPKDPLKCDIFSLGILIAFRISNGKHPYGEEDCDWEYRPLNSNIIYVQFLPF